MKHSLLIIIILSLFGIFPLPSSATDWPAEIVENGYVGNGYTHGQYPSKPGWTHAGVDIGSTCGAKIYSAADGIVVKSVTSKLDRDFASVGFAAVIMHVGNEGDDRSTFSAYFHMQQPISAALTTVSKGQAIGNVGETGAANGCHLHFEIRHFEGVRGLFHPEWKNIYGIGNKSESEVFVRDWSDPEAYMGFASVQTTAPLPRPENLELKFEQISEDNDSAAVENAVLALLQEVAPKDGANIEINSAIQLSDVQTNEIVEAISRNWNRSIIMGKVNYKRLIVTVAFNLGPDGMIVGDVTPIEPRNPTGDFKIAFDAARRTILRAQSIPLPPDLFPDGVIVEVRFDPAEDTVQYSDELAITPGDAARNDGSIQTAIVFDTSRYIEEFEIRILLESAHDIFDIIKSVKLWKNLHQLVIDANIIGDIDDSIEFLSNIEFVGSRLKSTQLVKIRDELVQKSVAGATSIIAHFYIDDLYDSREAKGETYRVSRNVAHSFADTAVNIATADISGQLFDQSLLVAEAYYDLSKGNRVLVETIIDGAEAHIWLLQNPTPENVAAARAFIKNTELVSRDIADGLTYAPHVDAAAKADIVIFMLKLKAFQITGQYFGLDVATVKEIVEIYDLEPKTLLGKVLDTVTLNNLSRILIAVDVQSTKYQDFADELANRFDVVGWSEQNVQSPDDDNLGSLNSDEILEADCQLNGTNNGPLLCPFREKNVCTGEGCYVSGIRKAIESAPVFREPDTGDPIYSIEPGEFVIAITTDVFSIPCRSTYFSGSAENSPSHMVYQLGYSGEGTYRYWQNGELKYTSLAGTLTPDQSCVQGSEDWIQIATEDGTSGWISGEYSFLGSSRHDEALGAIPNWIQSMPTSDRDFGRNSVFLDWDHAVSSSSCKYSDIANCMELMGASKAAVAFSRVGVVNDDIGGVMTDFIELGQVDIAEVYHPFQANPFHSFVFVNGTPSVFPPTSRNFRDMLRATESSNDPVLRYIQRSTTNATLSWKYGYTGHRNMGEGKQRFIFVFPVVAGCTACEVVGSALFYYDFDDGKNVDAGLIGYFNDWNNPTDQFRGDNANALIRETHVLQFRLNSLGYLAGTMDGQVGPKTRAAIQAFQSERCLSVTGEINRQTANAMAEFEVAPINCEKNVSDPTSYSSDWTLFGTYESPDQPSKINCATAPITINATQIVFYESSCQFPDRLDSKAKFYSAVMSCKGEGLAWLSDKNLSLNGPDLVIASDGKIQRQYSRCNTQNQPSQPIALSNNEPTIKNLADYLETNVASALSSLETGRNIRFVAGNVTYQNGKMLMKNTVSPTSAVEAVENLQKTFSWDAWFDVTQGNNPTSRALSVYCIFDPKNVTNVSNGEILAVSAKLVSYENGSFSGGNLVLDCKR